MHSLGEIFSSTYLGCALVGWFVAQGLKIVTNAVTEHKLNLRLIVGSGGMPSSHSSMVMSLTTYVGIMQGFDTPLFALGLVFSFVVMYDAAGVRRETGRQGKAINDIFDLLMSNDAPLSEQLKEIVGHSPFEVAMGALTGILVALAWAAIVG